MITFSSCSCTPFVNETGGEGRPTKALRVGLGPGLAQVDQYAGLVDVRTLALREVPQPVEALFVEQRRNLDEHTIAAGNLPKLWIRHHLPEVDAPSDGLSHAVPVGKRLHAADEAGRLEVSEVLLEPALDRIRPVHEELVVTAGELGEISPLRNDVVRGSLGTCHHESGIPRIRGPSEPDSETV